MENYFKLLDQPARPILNDDELRKSYLSSIEKNHPDRSGTNKEDREKAEEKTAQINRAYQVLKYGLERYRHLLELNGVKLDSKAALPDGISSLFEQLFEISRNVEKFVEDFKAADSEIEKTFLRHTQLSLVGDIQTAQRQLNRFEQSLQEQVQRADDEWDVERDLEKLGNTVQSMAFCQKWQSQLDRFKGEVLSRV